MGRNMVKELIRHPPMNTKGLLMTTSSIIMVLSHIRMVINSRDSLIKGRDMEMGHTHGLMDHIIKGIINMMSNKGKVSTKTKILFIGKENG